MQRNFDQGALATVFELEEGLSRGIESSEGVNVVQVVETLGRCECRSEKEREAFLKCVVTVLSLLSGN